MRKLLLVFCLGITAISLFSQDKPGKFRYFDEPIMIDTSATLLIPIRYNTEFMSKNKFGLQSYYANILVTTSDDAPPRKLNKWPGSFRFVCYRSKCSWIKAVNKR